MTPISQDHPRWIAPVAFALTLVCAMMLSLAKTSSPGGLSTHPAPTAPSNLNASR